MTIKQRMVRYVAGGISGFVGLPRLGPFGHSTRSWQCDSAIHPRLLSRRDTGYSGLG
ncbi:hypothetical protein [Paraburkholderia tropica]|uniref:hypothetical protein n=1 Tax=Paraburkholderia tropica TaxID=92647 RepID=UPI00137478A4|nr:hypothetical protein [Paraburkholderia tropica]